MKKTGVILSAMLIALLFLTGFQAKNKKDYFAGKWKILVTGIPEGDETVILSLERKNGKLTGTIKRKNQENLIQISEVAEKDNSITFYFYAESANLDAVLKKKDENRITGYIGGMYPAEGTRIAPEKKK